MKIFDAFGGKQKPTLLFRVVGGDLVSLAALSLYLHAWGDAANSGRRTTWVHSPRLLGYQRLLSGGRARFIRIRLRSSRREVGEFDRHRNLSSEHLQWGPHAK